MTIITITDLELAISACKAAHPPVDYVLGEELRAFGTIYGMAIYHRLLELNLDDYSPGDRALIEYWLKVAKTPRTCDPSDDMCEVCQ